MSNQPIIISAEEQARDAERRTVKGVTPRIVDVNIQPWSDGTPDPKPLFSVHPVWVADNIKIDRPESAGWVMDRRLAERLKRAILAGAVHEDAKVMRDINGKTYVQARTKVLGRYANADLKRLGF